MRPKKEDRSAPPTVGRAIGEGGKIVTEAYDAIVLGTGNAGMAAAGALRAAGKSVAMVESWDVGGTCPLRGCVPKK
ncbi:MAG: FAD-dependent oxidoreductase, partial [Proteobacteria bacterium]|nr:FAD-dependent oxidoreductase [Pseudomonadota bacterium]